MKNIARDMLASDVLKAVIKAEKKSEYKYGPAIYIDDKGAGHSCFLNVTFYPYVHWWVSIENKRYIPVSEALLTGKIEPFRL